MGSKLILTNEPENVKAIMSTQLAKSRPGDFDITEGHVSQLLMHLLNDEEPVEVYDLVDRLLLDVVTHIFFGESANSLQSSDQPFRDALDTLLTVNTKRLLVGPIALLFPDWLIAPKATTAFNNYMDIHVQRIIQRSKLQVVSLSDKDHTFMDALAVNEPDAKYIKDQLVSVLLAGKDPVAIIITWILYELSRRPETMKRLRTEISNIVGFATLPDATHLKNMTFLKNIVKETLRLYHPLGFNIREARHDTTLPVGGGEDGQIPIAIPKGIRKRILHWAGAEDQNRAKHKDGVSGSVLLSQGEISLELSSWEEPRIGNPES
ncbi:hypothetical protein V493_05365 [Pseudogymnoascus sp. VKM F-4281 (FW-2241)]|nr:hypothetical protein V493_05365 [Pseudogymnoascus sp. VKM F-4281 (FW-2241)]